MKGSTKWVANEVRGLPTYVSGRVALLGDAVSLEHLPASIIYIAHILYRTLIQGARYGALSGHQREPST